MSATIFIQVGQCGNQVGEAFWQRVQNSIVGDGGAGLGPDDVGHLLREDSRGKLHARAVMVDTEPKVVEQCMLGPAGNLLDPTRVATCHHGRGNNWAFGFFGYEHVKPRDPVWREEAGALTDRPAWKTPMAIKSELKYHEEERSVVRRALEAVRKEAEAADSVPDVVLLHSLAGGTGSGLGSRVLVSLRDAIGPKAFVMASSVAPRIGGDTVLQPYNVALSAKRLREHADGIAMFDNGALLDLLAPQRGPRAKAVHAGITEVNEYIASCLAGTLLPASGGYGGTPLQDLIAHVAPDPKCKFFEIHAAATTSEYTPLAASAAPWTEVARKLSSAGPRALDGGVPVTSAASVVTAWGLDLAAPPPPAAPKAKTRVRAMNPGNRDAFARPQNVEVDPKEAAEFWTGAVLEAFERASGNKPLEWAETMLRTSRTCPVAVVPPDAKTAAGRGGAVRRTPSSSSSRGALSYGQALTVASSRSTTAQYFNALCTRADELMSVGAYVHHYERYGLHRTHLRAAVDAAADIRDDCSSVHGLRWDAV
ncbi:unnamed protein product [Pedinophyceae sp. YPF-701]|nr:unnamed protein product [Pedinophyceae sp. YPF-701]